MADNKNKIIIQSFDPSVTDEDLTKLEKEGESIHSPLIKSIVNSLRRAGDKIMPLAFTEDPSSPNRYGGLYYQKLVSVPDQLLKRVAITDDLVAACTFTRANHLKAYGKELEERHDFGYRIELTKEAIKTLDTKRKTELIEKMKKASKLLGTCGFTAGWYDDKKSTLSEFLFQSARNAVIFGRFATEIIWVYNKEDEKVFHSFRARDPATILKLLPKPDHAADQIRRTAYKTLQELSPHKLIQEESEDKEWAYIQVFEGKPMQVFTAEEMVVHNCYPVTDFELNGYPLTPIDTAITAITTHINIASFNKMYFSNGRASRGMLTINSDEVDPSVLQDLKQQFQATINSTSNAFRMPVIKVGKEDKVQWQAIDAMQRDGEFQFLYDSISRIILAAFQMSPDELPGYSHLSKSTNNQSLSETSGEFKLEAARDVGIRPLVAHFQDFLNHRILPLLDEELIPHCRIRLHGLDSDDEKEETAILTEQMQVHSTMDEILERVEKPIVGKRWGGEFPLNPLWQQVADKYFTIGEIKEWFFGIEGASKDPKWDYAPNPFYFQQAQLVMGQQQMQMQNEVAQQQIAQQGGGEQDPNNPHSQEVAQGADQAMGHMNKSENPLTLNKKKLRAQHNALVTRLMDEWHKESEITLSEIAQNIQSTKKK